MSEFDHSYDVNWLRYPVLFYILLGWLNLKSQKNHDKHFWYNCSKHKWYEGLFLRKLYLIICGSISNFLWLLINCYKSFSSSRNISVRVVDDIAFLKSVEIRSLLLMSSQVCTLCCQEQDVQLFWSHYIISIVFCTSTCVHVFDIQHVSLIHVYMYRYTGSEKSHLWKLVLHVLVP